MTRTLLPLMFCSLCLLAAPVGVPAGSAGTPDAPESAADVLPPRPAWVAEVSLISAFDYNAFPITADRYGEAVDWEQTRDYLRRVRPDVLLGQGLGCSGIPSYDSDVIPMPENMRFGYLEQLKALCDEEGIPFGLYAASFTVRMDWWPFTEDQGRRWCVQEPDGTVVWAWFCPNGPWVEEYLAPLCLEMMDRFDPVMFWFDGTRTLPCYCAWCRERFAEEYGRELVPPADANEAALVQAFSDRSLVDAMERASRALLARDPELALCWGNATDWHTLRPAFAGQHLSASDELNTPNLVVAQFDATYRSTLGIPAAPFIPLKARTDLLYPRHRPRPLLLAELSTMLAHGLGVTLYHMPEPYGYLPQADTIRAEQAARFVRERTPFCLGNESRPHLGIVASFANNLRYSVRVQPGETHLIATHLMASQNHVPSEVVADEVLRQRISDYDLILLGEVPLLAPDTAAVIERYVAEGGRALLLGPSPMVAEAWAVQANSPRLFGLTCAVGQYSARHWDGERLVHLGRMLYSEAPVEIVWPRVEWDGQPAEPLLVRLPWEQGEVWWLLSDSLTEFIGRPEDTLRLANPGGSDRTPAQIVATAPAYTALGGALPPVLPEPVSWIDYSGSRPVRDPATGTGDASLRYLIGRALREALGERWLIRGEAPPGVEFVVNRREGDLYVHLVNHTFGHMPWGGGYAYSLDHLPVLAEISFELRLSQEVSVVEALPGNQPLHWERTDEGYRVTLPRLEHHTAVRFAGGG